MKKTVSVILLVCMLVPMFALFPINVSAAVTDGVTFGEEQWYQMDGGLKKAPNTYETWFYVPENHSLTERAGTIFGSYNGFDFPYLFLDIYSDGTKLYPRFEFKELVAEDDTDNQYYKFTNVTIERGSWIHLAIVVDPYMQQIHCYKNGELAETLTCDMRLIDIDHRVTELPIAVGNDMRRNQYYYFKGTLGSLTMFNDARNADQIKADYANGVDSTDPDILAHYEFSSSDYGKNVKDKSGNGPELLWNKWWLTEAEMQQIRGNDFSYAYSFAVVGDIQYVSDWDADHGTTFVKQQHQWIADNIAAKKIQYVIELGDVTDTDKDSAWKAAYNGIKVLNGKVPYSVIRGNHDFYIDGTGLDKYFAKDPVYIAQFDGVNGGLYNSRSVTNTWYTKEVNGIKWLFVNLDYSPNDSVLDWANEVIATHPDHNAIITTHCYLHMDGTTVDYEDYDNMRTGGNNGNEIWEELASLHKNVVMVISGHQESNLAMRTQAKGVNGNTVTQFLIDTQHVDKYFMNSVDGKPLGLVTMFYFDKDGKTVHVESYSPIRDKYYQTYNQFSFDMDAEAGEQIDTGWDGREKAPSGKGTAEDPYIISSGAHLLWMSNQINSRTKTHFEQTEAGHFAGKYFKQTCDIDLNGLSIRTIGYYYTSEYLLDGVNCNDMAAFGGHYDGGGFKIFNGSIIPVNVKHTSNYNWGDGLFGCIFGAVIENITLDDIDVWGCGTTGGIVGRANASPDGKAPENFNIISNCHVTESCNVTSVLKPSISLNKKLSYGNGYHMGTAVGGVCAMALGTTIKNCTFAGTIHADGIHNMVGGISSTIGYNSLIESCAFTGSIEISDQNPRTPVLPSAIGGIVGAFRPSEDKPEWDTCKDNTVGSAIIRNTYNAGTIVYTGNTYPIQPMYIGGIVGDASYLRDVATDAYVFLIENCFNKAQIKDEGAPGTQVGGIVAKCSSSEGSSNETLWIKNCASVTVGAVGAQGTNEYRYDDVTKADGYKPIEAVLEADGKSSVVSAEDWVIDVYIKLLSEGKDLPSVNEPVENQTTPEQDGTTEGPNDGNDVPNIPDGGESDTETTPNAGTTDDSNGSEPSKNKGCSGITVIAQFVAVICGVIGTALIGKTKKI